MYNSCIRKTYTEEFKTKIVLEIFKEEKTISQIASEYEVHPNQLNKPEIVNSDQRIQFISLKYTNTLLESQIKISMESKQVCFQY